LQDVMAANAPSLRANKTPGIAGRFVVTSCEKM
jgi:hypothetical protein